jgi:hypothetical protein
MRLPTPGVAIAGAAAAIAVSLSGTAASAERPAALLSTVPPVPAAPGTAQVPAPPSAAGTPPASAAGAPTASPPSAGAPPAPLRPAPAPADWAPPSFASDPFGAVAAATDLTLKLYGDTGFAVRDNAYLPWTTGTANADVYAPGVWNAFFAPRIDLFGAADVGRLAFLTEIMFEAQHNEIGVDLERVQLNYLFANWLRVRAGRTHVAWGYYNDTYHHGNLFELTTARPFSVNFEDSLGIIEAHNVGLGVDGTFDFGNAGSFRYDAEVGNGRAPDVTSVAIQFADKNEKAVNVRLRWISVDGIIVGINGMRDVVPALISTQMGVTSRPQAEELVGGVHAAYMENHVHADVEAFAMRHNPQGAPSTNIYGGFAELGYGIGAFTPYFRGEYMRFPSSGDIVFQYGPGSAQAALTGDPSIYFGTRDFSDLRVGVKWLPMPQLALKLEGERIGLDSRHQEIATLKAAFGFW